jgi:hypothetical protein
MEINCALSNQQGGSYTKHSQTDKVVQKHQKTVLSYPGTGHIFDIVNKPQQTGEQEIKHGSDMSAPNSGITIAQE